MQRLGQRPQTFLAVRGLDQDHAARIETKRVEAMSGKTAVLVMTIGRHDEDDGTGRRQTGENGDDETEGGGIGACGRGYDLMERRPGEATLRQVGIERGKAEGEDAGATLLSGSEQPAQFFHDQRAIPRLGKTGRAG